MSKWTWIDGLTREETQIHLDETVGEIDRLRLRILTLTEDKTRLEYHMNRLRREAGELK